MVAAAERFVRLVEDEFGIVIWDADRGAIESIGELENYVIDSLRFQRNDSRPFPNGVQSFCELRRILCETASVDRSNVRLRARLATLIPRRNRRLSWRLIEKSLDLRLPKLQRTTACVASFAFSIPAFFFGGLIWLHGIDAGAALHEYMMSSMLAGFFLLPMAWRTTEHWARIIPWPVTVKSILKAKVQQIGQRRE